MLFSREKEREREGEGAMAKEKTLIGGARGPPETAESFDFSSNWKESSLCLTAGTSMQYEMELG